MLIKHSFQYLLARGLPGIINFLALAVYTRLLAPEEFGRYALVLTGVGLADVFLFQWLRLVVDRFLAAQGKDSGGFLGGVVIQFSALAVFVATLGLVTELLWPDPVWRRLLALAVPLTISQAFFELSLIVLKAKLQPGRYGRLLFSKSALALGLGALLAWIGLGANAPLLGLIVGQVLAFILFGRVVWRGIRWRWPDAETRREQLAYGLPLVLTFALGWVVSGSDRWLIGWLLGAEAVGQYAATYDLGFQSLTLLLSIINTAAFPLAVRAHESGSTEKAREQLRHNGELILAAALGGGAALAVLTPAMIGVFIGESYRDAGLTLFPWIALAAALSGIKAFHFDIGFHLGKQSRWLVAITALAAMANILLNLLLIPAFGILGAAWATVLAYGFGMLISALVGHRLFAMPEACLLLIKGGGFAVITGGSVAAGMVIGETPALTLGMGLLVGSLGAGLAAYMLNLNDIRTLLPVSKILIFLFKWHG